MQQWSPEGDIYVKSLGMLTRHFMLNLKQTKLGVV